MDYWQIIAAALTNNMSYTEHCPWGGGGNSDSLCWFLFKFPFRTTHQVSSVQFSKNKPAYLAHFNQQLSKHPWFSSTKSTRGATVNMIWSWMNDLINKTKTAEQSWVCLFGPGGAGLTRKPGFISVWWSFWFQSEVSGDVCWLGSNAFSVFIAKNDIQRIPPKA